MATWTPDELDRVGTADELELTVSRPDGTPRAPVAIWVVRAGDDLYVRSWRGAGGGWFRAAEARPEGRISAGGVDKAVRFVGAGDEVNDAVDDAYRTKYARYPDYVGPMVSTDVRATTLKLTPR